MSGTPWDDAWMGETRCRHGRCRCTWGKSINVVGGVCRRGINESSIKASFETVSGVLVIMQDKLWQPMAIGFTVSISHPKTLFNEPFTSAFWATFRWILTHLATHSVLMDVITVDKILPKTMFIKAIIWQLLCSSFQPRRCHVGQRKTK